MLKESIAIALGLALSAGVVAQDAEEEEAVLLESETSFFSGWDGNVSFGLFGTSGNANRFNTRAEFDGARKTDRHLTTFLGTFTKAKDGGDTSEQKGRFFANNDFIIENSEWTVFANGNFEYDEFKEAWDTRLSLFGGLGRILIEEEETFLNAKAGLGAVRQIGGEDEDWTFEGLLAADFTHELTESQSLEAKLILNPDLEDFGEYRLFTRLAWTMMVDPSVNMSLVVGAENTYESDPDAGDENNDIDYFVLLSWAY